MPINLQGIEEMLGSNPEVAIELELQNLTCATGSLLEDCKHEESKDLIHKIRAMADKIQAIELGGK